MAVNDEPFTVTVLQNKAGSGGQSYVLPTGSDLERSVQDGPGDSACRRDGARCKKHRGTFGLVPIALDLFADLLRADTLFIRAGPEENHVRVGCEALHDLCETPLLIGVG